MEGSMRTTTRIGHLYSLTKNKQKKQKRYNLRTESLLSNNTSNGLSSLWLQPVGKPVDLVAEMEQ